MKKLMNLGKALSQIEQKQINGGHKKKACYAGTDSICCGTAAWQCGVGPSCGGFFNGNYCNCV